MAAKKPKEIKLTEAQAKHLQAKGAAFRKAQAQLVDWMNYLKDEYNLRDDDRLEPPEFGYVKDKNKKNKHKLTEAQAKRLETFWKYRDEMDNALQAYANYLHEEYGGMLAGKKWNLDAARGVYVILPQEKKEEDKPPLQAIDGGKGGKGNAKNGKGKRRSN